MVNCFASLAYLCKVNKVGECRFTIDEQQLVRDSRLGPLTVPWNDIVAVHRYSQGWLVAKASGAMPLPFRCMTAQQITEFTQFVQNLPLAANPTH